MLLGTFGGPFVLKEPISFLVPDSCISFQIVHAIRYYPEFGLTDGEGMERLWSYLRQFTAITKEMTPSHRTDLLTDGLIHFAKRKNKSMGMFSNSCTYDTE